MKVGEDAPFPWSESGRGIHSLSRLTAARIKDLLAARLQKVHARPLLDGVNASIRPRGYDWEKGRQVPSKRDIIQGLKSPAKDALRHWISWTNSGGVSSRIYLDDYKILFPAAGFLNFFFKSTINHDVDLAFVIDRFLRPDDLVIDVGANIGLTVFLFARKLAPGSGRVVALEPSREARNFLEANCAINGLRSVTILPVGAGGKTQSAELYSHKCDGSRSSSLIASYVVEGASSTESIELTTLDAVIEREGVPRLIKIDVEGFEESVLDGLTNPEVWNGTILFVELRKATFEPVVERLERKGHTVFFVRENQLVEIEKLNTEECFYDHLAMIDVVSVPKLIPLAGD